MVSEEFDQTSVRPEFPMPDPIPFPEEETSDENVPGAVRERLSLNPYQVENDFSISYVGPQHPISRSLMISRSYFQNTSSARITVMGVLYPLPSKCFTNTRLTSDN